MTSKEGGNRKRALGRREGRAWEARALWCRNSDGRWSERGAGGIWAAAGVTRRAEGGGNESENFPKNCCVL